MSMAGSTTGASKPRRRWLSISLRGTLLLVLVLGGLMGWRARRASLQRRGVAAIERLRGSVVYDWQYGGNLHLRTGVTVPPGPGWLRRALGDEYFQEVAQVNIPGNSAEMPGFLPELGEGPDSLAKWAEARKAHHEKYIKPIEDDQLACLDYFDRLQALVVADGVVRREGLDRLTRRPPGLTELHVFTRLDPEDLHRLGAFKDLETLTVQTEMGPGASLAFLGRLPRLRRLVLSRGTLTDEELDRIGRVATLEQLTISGTKFDDSALARLSGLKSLQYLALMGCPGVTDAGLAHLEGMSKLNSLTLAGARLTGAARGHVDKLPALASLMFKAGGIDPNDLAAWAAEKPGLTLMPLP